MAYGETSAEFNGQDFAVQKMKVVFLLYWQLSMSKHRFIGDFLLLTTDPSKPSVCSQYLLLLPIRLRCNLYRFCASSAFMLTKSMIIC